MNDLIRYLFIPARVLVALLLLIPMTVVFFIGCVLYPYAWKDYREAVFSICRFVRNGIDSY